MENIKPSFITVCSRFILHRLETINFN